MSSSLNNYLDPEISHYNNYNNSTRLTLSTKGKLFPELRHPLTGKSKKYKLSYTITPPLVPSPISEDLVINLFKSRIRRDFPNFTTSFTDTPSKPLTVSKAKRIIRKANNSKNASSASRTAHKILSEGLAYFGVPRVQPIFLPTIDNKKLKEIQEYNECSALFASEKFIQLSKKYRNFGRPPSAETISSYSNRIQEQIENFPILFMPSSDLDSLLIQQIAESKDMEPSTIATAINLGDQIDQALERNTHFSKIREELFTRLLNHLIKTESSDSSNQISEKVEALLNDPSFINPLMGELASRQFHEFAGIYNIFGAFLSQNELDRVSKIVRHEIENSTNVYNLSSDTEDLISNSLFQAKGLSKSEYLPLTRAGDQLNSLLENDADLAAHREELFPLVFDRLFGPLSDLSPADFRLRLLPLLRNNTLLREKMNSELDTLAVLFETAGEMQSETLYLDEEELRNLCFDEGLCAGITTEYAASRLKSLGDTVACASQFPCRPAISYCSGTQLHPLNLNYESLSKARYITAACSSAESLSRSNNGPLSNSYDFYHIVPKKILRQMGLTVTSSFPESSPEKLAHVPRKHLPSEIRAHFNRSEDKQSLLNIYLMNQKENAWHAMTIQASSPFHFLDPNLGIVSVDSLDDLIGAIQAHIKVHYPDYQDLFIREIALKEA